MEAKNSFEVLGVLPQNCSREVVLQKYEEKMVMFKKHFRNKTAVLAKSRCDNAKMRLLNDALRKKEEEAFNNSVLQDVESREEMRLIEERTNLLEMRAFVISQNQQS